ncbi:hypothetical protein M231_01941 [Tremella mesenterica]|uniref:Uncharacterized protein n=1 Tax=Tremella mesenterica TaxID=5217 RepID=A0A4Q1BRY7_TREME|nr:uncharacterized protein TREMEDRAFT_59594 [Tremella mesenterica DSM 1558]EIW73429.1 hypothetical protein TREMEDRAFT_59594 [Tremella mesenterica DSM 1558]RXK40690.1 hypothetical protein M231_01941 [Tremella mesenterica]
MPRPDLTFPGIPDVEEMDRQAHSRPREVLGGVDRMAGNEYTWPEAGPSDLSSSSVAGGVKKEPRFGPYGAKMIASMTGAMAVSLLMSPFDVVKTRLQTVQPSPNFPDLPATAAEECCQTSVLTPPSTSKRPTPTTKTTVNPLTCYTTASSSPEPPARQSISFASLRPAATPASAPAGCLHPSKWAGIWGEAVTFEEALARGVVGMNGNATLVLPRNEGLLGGFWNEIATVRGEAGVRGLWKGVGTTLTMSIPSTAIYMLGYEFLLSRISPFFTNSDDPLHNSSSLNRSSSDTSKSTTAFTPAPLIAGSLARTWSATVISPIEMFRTRLLARPTSQTIPTYASTFKGLSVLVKDKGPTILWRGLGPTLWRDVPFSGAYWAGFELLKSNLSSPSFPMLDPITTTFLSGAISGTFAALLTQPFDVLKTRRQVFTPSPNCSPAALRSHASTLPLALYVIETEGWRTLFAGLSARCGKVAPACGLMIASYEGVQRWLRES